MRLGQIEITKVELSFAFLLFVLVAGTQPFLGGNIQSTGLESKASMLDVLLYLLPSSGVLFFGLNSFTQQQFLKQIWPIVLVLIYCGLTISWSATPQIALLRFILLSIVTIAMAVAVYHIETDRLWNILAIVLGTIAVVNLASVLLIPDAVHRADDISQKLAGAWKGLHLHKNIAGPVAAVSSMYFLVRLLQDQHYKSLHSVLFVISLIFLVGTDSRTSLYLFAISLLLIIIRRGLLRVFGPLLINFVIINLIIILGVFLTVFITEFEILIEDDKLLTGRGEVWRSLITYITHHPLTGAGFNSFWRVGFDSPIFTLTDGWPTKTGQGHSGYLDLAATIGIPGLILVLLVFFVRPVFAFIKTMAHTDPKVEFLLAVFIFSILHNLFETSLLEARSPGYIFWMLSIFLLDRINKSQDCEKLFKTKYENF